MKKMKMTVMTATLVLAATFGVATIASAWGGHGGGCRYGNGGGYAYGHGGYQGGYSHGGGYHGGNGYGPAPQAMSQEQQTMRNDYDKKAGPLVSRLRAKQAEMDALYAQGQPEGAKTQALAKEIGDLQGQLYQVDSEFGAKMRAEGGYAGAGHYGGRYNGGGGYGGHHGGHR